MLEQIWAALASWTTLDSGLRYATPLIFAAMAGLIAERSGTVDISLEGKMLAGAFAGAAAASVTGSILLGVLAAMLIGMLLSLVHGLATIKYKGDHVISGLAINFFASGMTITLGHAWFKRGGQTPTLGDGQRFTDITLPFAETLKNNVPIFGDFYADVLSGQTLLVYLSFVVVFLVWWMLFKTTFGLRLRAVGEEPSAVDSAGISVAGMRYKALILTGMLCGVGGAYFSMAQNAQFGREMTAGAGYIALAAVITGKWRPWGTLAACLLFGVLTALEGRMAVVQGVPTQVFTALPYIITMILLVGFIGKSIAPKAIGKPYVKER
jgi:simple sugar transport system permease protein